MTIQTATLPGVQNLADLLERLGSIPASRVRFYPPPGTAKEEDVVEAERRDNSLCELVDGVLVEKPMGFVESALAVFLSRVIGNFVAARNLGIVAGPDGMLRLAPGAVRLPDVAFVSWARLPGQKYPRAAVPPIAPDLAIEVLSPSNTAAEMERKRGEYFAAGVRLVWMVDPATRTVAVFTSPGQSELLGAGQVLRGEPALPGFELPVAELFGELDRHGAVTATAK